MSSHPLDKPASLGVDRFHEQRILQDFDAASVGLPAILGENSGLKRLPAFEFDGYQSIVGSSCADTVEAHTQWMYSSSLSKVIGGHNLKFAGEQRQFPLLGTALDAAWLHNRK